MADADYRLELSSAPTPRQETTAAREARRWLSVWFTCCRAYQRVYRSRDGRSYAGHCPRCARQVRFRVGEGGTSCRQFIAE